MHIGDKGKEEWSSNAAIWRYSKICAGISSRIKIGVDLTRRPGADDNISGHTEHFTERRVIRKIKEKIISRSRRGRPHVFEGCNMSRSKEMKTDVASEGG